MNPQTVSKAPSSWGDPEKREHYANFYAGAIAAGLRFVRLRPRDKRCASGTWETNVRSTPEEILTEMAKGFNVGFLLQSKEGMHPNPLGVWGLDIDTESALQRFSDAPFTVMITRGHPFKRHYLARLPDPSAPRASRLIRDSHDVKLTGVLTAPGSTHIEGGTYEVFTRVLPSETWQKWDGVAINWALLPVVDPSAYIPAPPELVPNSPDYEEKVATNAGEEWVFKPTVPRAKWVEMPYVTMAGKPIAGRFNQGRWYIKNRINYGIVSCSGNGGNSSIQENRLRLRCC